MAKTPAPEIKARALEETRIRRGLTRRMLAEKVGTTYGNIYNLESGTNRRIGRELLQRIADALQVTPADLANVTSAQVAA